MVAASHWNGSLAVVRALQVRRAEDAAQQLARISAELTALRREAEQGEAEREREAREPRDERK